MGCIIANAWGTFHATGMLQTLTLITLFNSHSNLVNTCQDSLFLAEEAKAQKFFNYTANKWWSLEFNVRNLGAKLGLSLMFFFTNVLLPKAERILNWRWRALRIGHLA